MVSDSWLSLIPTLTRQGISGCGIGYKWAHVHLVADGINTLLYQWLSASLQYLQRVSNGVTKPSTYGAIDDP